jgi:coniferyl-aldehyde dehydrogenase
LRLQDLVAARFAADEVAVVTGDADVGRAFTQLAFDHLFFTGSTTVGRQVALAAAQNLTPVTLELGGKSPTILCDDFDVDEAASRILYAKFLNAGQTCLAPDYLLISAASRDRSCLSVLHIGSSDAETLHPQSPGSIFVGSSGHRS